MVKQITFSGYNCVLIDSNVVRIRNYFGYIEQLKKSFNK